MFFPPAKLKIINYIAWGWIHLRLHLYSKTIRVVPEGCRSKRIILLYVSGYFLESSAVFSFKETNVFIKAYYAKFPPLFFFSRDQCNWKIDNQNGGSSDKLEAIVDSSTGKKNQTFFLTLCFCFCWQCHSGTAHQRRPLKQTIRSQPVTNLQFLATLLKTCILSLSV